MRDPNAQASFREKLVLFAVLWSLWGLTYYVLALLPHAPNGIVPWDPVWRMPYVPAFVIPYTSAYFLPFALLVAPCDRRTFLRFCAAVAVAMLVSAPFFVLMPLTPPRISSLGDGPLDVLLALQYRFDVNGNCFPSLHVSISTLIALTFGRCVPRLRWPALAWAATIAVSTVLVHQHYAVDAVAGAALALSVWRIFFPPRASA